MGALGGLEQLGADFLAGNVASICAKMQEVPMLAVAEPPDAAADESEKDKADGEGEKDFVFPEVERPPQLGEFIAEALNLEVGVAGGVVVKVAVVSPFVAVVELQSAALSLVAGRVRVCVSYTACTTGPVVRGSTVSGAWPSRPRMTALTVPWPCPVAPNDPNSSTLILPIDPAVCHSVSSRVN